MEENNKIKIIAIIIIIIFIIVGFIISKIKEKNNFKEIEYNEILETTENAEIEEKLETIKIHISGEVNYNGILELDEGARIDDAIKIAGGLTEKADITKVNLAYILLDGQKLYIPNRNNVGVAPQGDPQIITDQNGEGIIENNQNFSEKININTATQTELEELSGVGPSLALKIIKYREENGKFKSKEELKNVPGIGENKYKQIEEFVEIK